MVNRATIDLIRAFEGERLRAYRDPAGLLTIGVGHLVKKGEPYKLGHLIAAEESERLLRKDLQIAERAVRKGITALLNENQYGALVSFAFNLGASAFNRSTLRRKVNAGDFDGAAAEFGRWNKARNPKTKQLEVLRGLTRRRAAERALFLTRP